MLALHHERRRAVAAAIDLPDAGDRRLLRVRLDHADEAAGEILSRAPRDQVLDDLWIFLRRNVRIAEHHFLSGLIDDSNPQLRGVILLVLPLRDPAGFLLATNVEQMLEP